MMKRPAIVGLTAALAPLMHAEDAGNWVTGGVAEISNTKVDYGDYWLLYTDYAVRVGNKEFIRRPDPTEQKPRGIWKITALIGIGGGLTSTVIFPVNVGDNMEVQKYVDRAQVRFGNRKYGCAILRQVLLSTPAEAKPESITRTAHRRPRRTLPQTVRRCGGVRKNSSPQPKPLEARLCETTIRNQV
jgi:hypothetical protein